MIKRILVLFCFLSLAHVGFAMPTDVEAIYKQELEPELNHKYQELLIRVKAISPSGEEELRKSERAWIKYRDQECKKDGYRHYVPHGDGAPHFLCISDLTQERIKVLELQLLQFEK